MTFGLSVFALAQAAPDLILYNGKVFTSDDARPYVQAVAIHGDKISAIGSNEQIKILAGDGTRQIDLGGRTVVPGFNDAHVHFAAPIDGTDLRFGSNEPTWVEVAEMLKNAVKTTPKGGWIFGTVGGKAMSDERAVRRSLDVLAPDHPVLLTAYYGHGRIFNTRAMGALEIAEIEPDVAGGRFERDAKTKVVNGRVFEYAQWQYDRKLAAGVSDSKLIAALRAMSDEELSFGITSIQVMAMMPLDRFVRLIRAAKIPVRVRAIPFSMSGVKGRDLSEIRDMKQLKQPGSSVTVSGIKWVLDGTPFERASAMRVPYADKPDTSGIMNFDQAEIEAMLRESLRFDEPILFHAVGDRSVAVVLDAMQKVGSGKVDWPSKRVRIEHGEGVSGDLIERARKLGVIVVQNPTHFTMVEMFYARWTPQMKHSTQRTLIDSGVPYALGSDGPANTGLNVMLASIHPARPTEAISREQAVKAYTYGSAFAEFAEKQKGTISVGKLADLAVLSQDIFSVPPDAMPGTASILTIIGGKVVYDKRILQ